MKRKITLAILILVCFLLQTTVFRFLEFGQVAPNLLIVLTISFGFMQGKKEGLMVGFFCGLLIDIFHGDVLGFYAMLYMYIGYLSGCFCKIFFDEDIKVPIVMVAAGDFALNFAIYILRFLFRGRIDLYSYLKMIFLPEIVYTVLLAVILYRIFYRINKWLVAGEMRGTTALWLRD